MKKLLTLVLVGWMAESAFCAATVHFSLDTREKRLVSAGSTLAVEYSPDFSAVQDIATVRVLTNGAIWVESAVAGTKDFTFGRSGSYQFTHQALVNGLVAEEMSVFCVDMDGGTEIVDGIPWTYTVSNDKVEIRNGGASSAIPSGTTGAITVPSTLGGCPVTSIGDYAFITCGGLTSVTIPSSVTIIGNDAFYGCTGLMSVMIPSSVTSIGRSAFYGCSGLASISVDVNNSSYSSQDGLLYNKTKSELIHCPGGKTGVVTIPASVTRIGYGDSCPESSVFDCCSGLTSISVNANNPSYSSQDGLLYNKTKSELIRCPEGKTGALTIPSSVTSIGDSAFRDCIGLTSVTIPSSVTSICGFAFEGCAGLTSVTIPSSVTYIGDDAFYGCTGLKSVRIPSSVTSLGYFESGGTTFWYCSSMTSISVDANNPSYSSQDGILYNKTKSELICCPGGKKGTVTIPSSVTSICEFAFEGCAGLTSVTIPSSMTSIGNCVFYGCSGLTSVTIPFGVTSIGNDAFWRCSSLTSVTIPSSVTSIGVLAFSGCSGLMSVTIPPSVTSIGDYAFKGCSSLKTIYVAIGDTQRIKNMLSGAGVDVSGLQFVESDTVVDGEDCGGDCSPEEGGGGIKMPLDGNMKHIFNGLVRDASNEPCGLIQVTTAKATKKGVKVSGFVMLEDGKKVTMKAVTVAVQNGLLAVSTTVGKLGSISLTIGGDGFAGTFGAKKVASEKLDEDTGVLKTTVKVTYLDAATGKLKTKNMTLNGVSVPQSAAGVLTSKGSAAKKFEAVVDCEACRPE